MFVVLVGLVDDVVVGLVDDVVVGFKDDDVVVFLIVLEIDVVGVFFDVDVDVRWMDKFFFLGNVDLV